MKRYLFLFLIFSSIIVSCKKDKDNIESKTRKIEYKVSCSHTNLGNISYTDTDGKDKTVVGEKIEWTSSELIMPQSVKNLSIKAEAPKHDNTQVYVTVKIYVDGELKKEASGNTIINDKITTNASYSF